MGSADADRAELENRRRDVRGRRSRGRALRRLRDGLLGRAHLLPDFLVIGALRCGAVRLFDQLSEHPNILGGPRATHFFDSSHYAEGLGWYRLRFPPNRARREAYARGLHPVLTGEVEPSYLAHPNVPARVARTLPGVRLVVLLRDPTERAASHWRWRRRRGLEERTFREVVEAEIGPPGDGAGIRVPSAKSLEDPLVVRRGLYQPALERWRTHFPDDRMLVLESERWFGSPERVAGEVCHFLELPPPAADLPALRIEEDLEGPVEADVLDHLREFYRPHNLALAEYLDLDLEWDARRGA